MGFADGNYTILIHDSDVPDDGTVIQGVPDIHGEPGIHETEELDKHETEIDSNGFTCLTFSVLLQINSFFLNIVLNTATETYNY